MNNQSTNEEKSYSYDIHSTKIYSEDKNIIKHLKSILNLKSEYEVINTVLEYFLSNNKTEMEVLKMTKNIQKQATIKIRQEVRNKLAHTR